MYKILSLHFSKMKVFLMFRLVNGFNTIICCAKIYILYLIYKHIYMQNIQYVSWEIPKITVQQIKDMIYIQYLSVNI